MFNWFVSYAEEAVVAEAKEKVGPGGRGLEVWLPGLML